MRRSVALLLLVALLGVGCADRYSLSGEAAEQLSARVAEVRSAAEAGDRRAALRAIAILRNAVDDAEELGQIGPDRAEEIRSAAAAVEAHLVLLVDEEQSHQAGSADPPPDEGDQGATEDEAGSSDDASTPGGGSKKKEKDDGGDGQGRGRGSG